MTETPSKILAQFPKNSKEQVRICRSVLNGRQLIDIRVYWQDKDGTWKPSPKGIAMDIQKLPLLIAAINQAVKEITSTPDIASDDGELLTEDEKAILSKAF